MLKWMYPNHIFILSNTTKNMKTRGNVFISSKRLAYVFKNLQDLKMETSKKGLHVLKVPEIIQIAKNSTAVFRN